MQKINHFNFNEVSNLNYNNYFIMPYYNEKTIVYISINKFEIKWYNYDLKPISPLKRINNSISKFYNLSKFKDHQIIIIGFLNKIQKFHSLAIFDLLLKEEFDGILQSKKYSIRYENIKNRFLINIPKSIKNIYVVFAQRYDESLFNNVVTHCIKSNIWEGYSLYKDKPYNYYDDKYSFINKKYWIIKSGEIIDIKFNTNKDNKFILNSLMIKNEDNLIYYVISDLEKIKISSLDDINLLKSKKINFKICEIDNTKYSKFISFI